MDPGNMASKMNKLNRKIGEFQETSTMHGLYYTGAHDSRTAVERLVWFVYAYINDFREIDVVHPTVKIWP